MWVSKFGRNFDQTSTPQATKFRPNFDQMSTNLGPNFDTPSVEVWSKFARYTNELIYKCYTNVYQTVTPNFDQTSTKLRPNFDLPVSKFGLIDDDRNNQHIVVFV